MKPLVSPHRKLGEETVHYQINVRWDSRIHPEDLKLAFEARLAQSLKRRERVSEKVIIEDFFIASLANHRPWNREQVEQIMKLSIDQNFCERFARALERGKTPTWDNIDILILQNWRDSQLGPKIIDRSGKKLPGLRDWSPIAAEKLFQFAKGKRERKSEPDIGAWFVTRRKRLGLAGQNRYEIKDLIENGDTARVIR